MCSYERGAGFGVLKKCAAKYGMKKGKLDTAVGEAIVQAADEVSRRRVTAGIREVAIRDRFRPSAKSMIMGAPARSENWGQGYGLG